MKRHITFYLITLSLVLSVSPIVHAFTFTTIEVPGSIVTQAFGINPSGQIVGSFEDSSGKFHGFLRNKNGSFTTIDVPGSTITTTFGINPSGQIVGSFEAFSGQHGFLFHGFLRDENGSFTTIDVPGAHDTQALGITPLGQIVGLFTDSREVFHGFLRDENGNFTTIDPPGSAFTEALVVNLRRQESAASLTPFEVEFQLPSVFLVLVFYICKNSPLIHSHR